MWITLNTVEKWFTNSYIQKRKQANTKTERRIGSEFRQALAPYLYIYLENGHIHNNPLQKLSFKIPKLNLWFELQKHSNCKLAENGCFRTIKYSIVVLSILILLFIYWALIAVLLVKHLWRTLNRSRSTFGLSFPYRLPLVAYRFGIDAMHSPIKKTIVCVIILR